MALTVLGIEYLIILGEIMVIVEYCRYGNLHSFLLKNRNRFIDQIDRYTDKIDSSIIEKRQSDDSGYDINRSVIHFYNYFILVYCFCSCDCCFIFNHTVKCNVSFNISNCW